MIFISNKYTRIYYNIVNNAKLQVRSKDMYLEKHHIIPTALGGPDLDENLIKLTAREHFICHWLLTKMTDGKGKSSMIYALSMMRCINRHQQRYNTKITSRVYESLKGKRVVSEETKSKMKISNRKGYGRVQSIEERRRRAISRTGLTQTEETKKKIGDKHRGKIVSEETRQKLREKRAMQITTEETRQKMSNSRKGKVRSEETKQKMKEARKTRKQWMYYQSVNIL